MTAKGAFLAIWSALWLRFGTVIFITPAWFIKPTPPPPSPYTPITLTQFAVSVYVDLFSGIPPTDALGLLVIAGGLVFAWIYLLALIYRAGKTHAA